MHTHRRQGGIFKQRLCPVPANDKMMVGGDDGGLWTSYDGGNRWVKSWNLPVSQFYHVSTDM